MLARRDAYMVQVGKPDGKMQLRWPEHRWGGNITMELQEIVLGWGGMYWIDVAQEMEKSQAVVNAAMNFLVP